MMFELLSYELDEGDDVMQGLICNIRYNNAELKPRRTIKAGHVATKAADK
jgi:hypothetical protein